MPKKVEAAVPMVAEQSQLPAVVEQEIEDLLATELRRGGFDLPMVKIIHAGGSFEMPDGEPAKTFQGVFLGEHRFNVFWWKKASDGESTPPDCSAVDAIMANRPFETDPDTGNPIFGECGSCYFNSFGSDGKGKRCSNKAHLMIWPTDRDAILPWLVTASSTSMMGPKPPEFNLGLSKAYGDLRQEMGVYNVPVMAMKAEFSLEKKQNGSQTYSVLRARCVGTLRDGGLSVADFQACKEFARLYLPQLHEVPVTADVNKAATENKFEAAKRGAVEPLEDAEVIE